VFHVLDTWQDGALRLADASERALRLQRQHHSRRAYSALEEIIRCAGAHEQGTASLVSFGHVAARVLAIARAGNAQLIVAGKERRSLLSELFFPSLTQRLLLDATADVLVLPISALNETLGVPLPQGRS
jgi:nucleotide-binding universal stress UspA family protein